MSQKLRLLACTAMLLSLTIILSCGGGSSNTKDGLLYLTTQGDSMISTWTIKSSDGTLSKIGNVPGPTQPVASLLNPAKDTLFVADDSANIYVMKLDSDGKIPDCSKSSSACGSQTTLPHPRNMSIDPGGQLLFVASQGTGIGGTFGGLTVYTISGVTLTQVGSPADTDVNGTSTGPTGVAVSKGGHYVYVSNAFTNTVSGYSYDSTGTLTPVIQNGPNSYPVGTTPRGIAVSSDGGYLYVANQVSNNISGFSICENETVTCVHQLAGPNGDGSLLTAGGSPYTSGTGPVSLAVNNAENYVYAVCQGSNQIFAYNFSPGNGQLTNLNPGGSLGTGGFPTTAAVAILDTRNLTVKNRHYIYVSNTGGNSISGYRVSNTDTGALSAVPVTTSSSTNQPTTVAVKGLK